MVNLADGPNHTSSELKSYFQQECAKRGVLFIGYHLVSLSHQKEHIDFTLDAYDEILGQLKPILDGGESIADHLTGEVIVPVFKNVGDRSSYNEDE